MGVEPTLPMPLASNTHLHQKLYDVNNYKYLINKLIQKQIDNSIIIKDSNPKRQRVNENHELKIAFHNVNNISKNEENSNQLILNTNITLLIETWSGNQIQFENCMSVPNKKFFCKNGYKIGRNN